MELELSLPKGIILAATFVAITRTAQKNAQRKTANLTSDFG